MPLPPSIGKRGFSQPIGTQLGPAPDLAKREKKNWRTFKTKTHQRLHHGKSECIEFHGNKIRLN